MTQRHGKDSLCQVITDVTKPFIRQIQLKQLTPECFNRKTALTTVVLFAIWINDDFCAWWFISALDGDYYLVNKHYWFRYTYSFWLMTKDNSCKTFHILINLWERILSYYYYYFNQYIKTQMNFFKY